MFSTRSLGLKGASKRSRDKAREKDKDSEKSKKKEDLDEAKFTPAQVSALTNKHMVNLVLVLKRMLCK